MQCNIATPFKAISKITMIYTSIPDANLYIIRRPIPRTLAKAISIDSDGAMDIEVPMLSVVVGIAIANP